MTTRPTNEPTLPESDERGRSRQPVKASTGGGRDDRDDLDIRKRALEHGGVLLLGDLHLDVHRRVRGHLPPERPLGMGQGRVDLPHLRAALPGSADLHDRQTEDDGTGPRDDRDRRGAATSARGVLRGRRGGQARQAPRQRRDHRRGLRAAQGARDGLSAEGRNAARASRRGRARLFRSLLLTLLLLVTIGATACSQETRDKLREAAASRAPSVSVSLSAIPTRSERPSRSPRPSQEPRTTASSPGRPSATVSERPTDEPSEKPTQEPSEKPTQEPSKKPKPSEATSPAAGAQPGGNGGASPAEPTSPVGSPTPIDVEASSHEETSSTGPLFFLLLLAALALVVGALMRRGRRIDERRRLAADALLACVRARDALATLVAVHERSPDRVAIAVQRIADSRTAVSSLGAAS